MFVSMVANRARGVPGWYVCAFVTALIGCSSSNSNGKPNTGGAGGTLIGGSGGGAGQGGIGAGGTTGGTTAGTGTTGGAGGTAGVGWTDCHETPAATPPPSTPLTPTICASPGGCTATALTYVAGTCGAYGFWQRTTGFELTECLFGANNVLVGERRCTDTGCQCRGTSVNVTACVDAGAATTTSCRDAASN